MYALHQGGLGSVETDRIFLVNRLIAAQNELAAKTLELTQINESDDYRGGPAHKADLRNRIKALPGEIAAIQAQLDALVGSAVTPPPVAAPITLPPPSSPATTPTVAVSSPPVSTTTQAPVTTNTSSQSSSWQQPAIFDNPTVSVSSPPIMTTTQTETAGAADNSLLYIGLGLLALLVMK